LLVSQAAGISRYIPDKELPFRIYNRTSLNHMPYCVLADHMGNTGQRILANSLSIADLQKVRG